MKNKKVFILVFVVALCCGVMALVDGIIQPDYWIKSAVKIVLFLGVPLLYSLYHKELDIKNVFCANKKGMKTAFMLCIPVFVVILGAYFVFKDIFDFSKITVSLTGNIGVNKGNFVYVALYISFVNSLLEEFFFRGFAFLTLRKIAPERFSYIFSAGVFALYHIAIMTGWFSALVFVIAIAGLFAGGLIFNYLNAGSDNIYTSWLVHMFANFAINAIGFMLFGII